MEELRLDGYQFDPFNPRTRSLLQARLGFAENSTIEASEDNSGSFNLGVWNVFSKETNGLVLKLVDNNRRHHTRATDAEKFEKFRRQCPNLVGEFSMSFPVYIFQLRAANGQRQKDLIVMRKAPGLQLTHILFHKYHANELTDLLRIFKEFGSFMATIHRVYQGMQHGDCQPSNVFYDKFNGFFTLIDIADFGYGPFIAEGGENDVEHFISGLKTLARWYGQKVISDAERQFREGYMEEKNKKRK